MHLLTRRQTLKGGAAVAAALFAKAAHASWKRRDEFEVTETTVYVRALSPGHDGLRVAQLSDVHVGLSTPASRVRAAVERINQAKVDVVLLTGDYVTNSERPVPRVGEWLAGLWAPTVAVLGNHDHWVNAPRLRKELEKEGYCVLANQHTTLTVRGEPVCLLGIDDAHSGHADVQAAFLGAPSTGTRLVLTHAPPIALRLPPDEGMFCVAGHTHGGQIWVPGLTGALLRRVGQPFVRGLYAVRGNQLYVNRGLGFGPGGPALRFHASPEVSMFTLRSAPPTHAGAVGPKGRGTRPG